MGYVRYSLMSIVLMFVTAYLIIGEGWFWAGFVLALVFVSLTDEIFCSNRLVYQNLNPVFMNAVLYATLPFLVVLTLIYATYLSEFDPFGIIALANVFGIDLAANRDATTTFHLIGGALSLGVISGSAGVNVAHELMHRTHSKIDVAISRWLLVFTCDTTFAIEHVFGHHRHVATDRDPATARRGESFFAFLIRSTIGQIRGAFITEARRLRNRGQSVWSWQNRAARGQIMSLFILGGYFYAAGWAGVLAFLVVALLGKTHLEAINYIEHYGLVRVPGTKVAARHSWDCYKQVSSALLYNLTRHADHHLDAQKAYWQLEARRDAPLMPFGYMTMMLIAFIPPLWRKVMTPNIQNWDQNFASPEECALLEERGLIGKV